MLSIPSEKSFVFPYPERGLRKELVLELRGKETFLKYIV